MVELLAYSGCSLDEVTSLKWQDIDFEKGISTATGGEGGMKNHERRTVPLTSALRTLRERLRDERKPQPGDFITQIDSATKCLATACRRLSYSQFTHHDFRQLFATSCIEAVVDIPTVSLWLRHKDRGALAMRICGNVRDEHNVSMIRRVSF